MGVGETITCCRSHLMGPHAPARAATAFGPPYSGSIPHPLTLRLAHARVRTRPVGTARFGAHRTRDGRMPGIVAAIKRGDDAHKLAAGHTTFERAQPMQCDTIFQIASVTKPIVAVAAMVLLEKGKVRLDDSVDHWLPELADRQVLRTIESELDDTVPANPPISLPHPGGSVGMAATATRGMAIRPKT